MECTPVEQYIPFIPAMVVMAAFAKGESVFRRLDDLRLDEPDGIALIEKCISALGIRHGSMPDGIILKGGYEFDGFDCKFPLPAACAGAFVVAALRCTGTSTINDERLQERLPYLEALLKKVCEYRT